MFKHHFIKTCKVCFQFFQTSIFELHLCPSLKNNAVLLDSNSVSKGNQRPSLSKKASRDYKQ
ncbi:Uncharacterised protein [Mycobacteroides abscessus subsp. abscessus]|nr:Uncharacterised protein [Mycobacteroides abscessus subsp. abscessus]